MKRIAIVVMAVLTIVAAAGAYLLKTDENGRPYGVYEVQVVGGGSSPAGFYLLNNTGANPLYTPNLADGNYYLGVSSILATMSGAGAVQNLTSFNNGMRRGLDVSLIDPVVSRIYDGMGSNPITSTNDSGKRGLDVHVSNDYFTPVPNREIATGSNYYSYSSYSGKYFRDVSNWVVDEGAAGAFTSQRRGFEWWDGVSWKHDLIVNPVPFAIYGYPSSAQNLFENENARPLYTKKAGGTITGTTSGNGTTTIFTPTGAAVVSNVVLTTESNAGKVIVEFASGQRIAAMYCTRHSTFNSGEIKSKGSTGNAVRIVSSSFAGAEETFYSITYTEE